MSSTGGRRKKRVTRRPMAGAGFFSDLASTANNFLKKTKILSTLGGVLGSAGIPYASTAGKLAGNLGYGRKKRVGRPRAGARRGRGAMLF